MVDMWTSDPDYKDGITCAEDYQFHTIFNDSGTWKLILSTNNGNWFGYYWSGSAWVGDSAIVAGLVDTGPRLSPTVFNDAGTLKLIYADMYYQWVSHYWNVDTWTLDPSICAGLPDIFDYNSCRPHFFDHNGDWKIIAGASSYATPKGFSWNGSVWAEDTAVVAGLGSIGDWADYTTYNDMGVLKLIAASNSGFVGFYWDTDTWVSDNDIVSGLAHNTNESIDIYNNGVNLVLLQVLFNGTWSSYTADAPPAHTFDAKSTTSDNSNPVNALITTTTGATVLVVGIVVGGTTARTGGAPTFDSVALTQAGTVETAEETNCEMWYLLNPSIGAIAVVIPNTLELDLHVVASSYKSSSGITEFDGTIGDNGVTTDPQLAITPSVGSSVSVDCLGTGRASPPSTWNQTLLYQTDNGTYCDCHQYALQTDPAELTFLWDAPSDDWCMILSTFIPGAGAGPTEAALVLSQAMTFTDLSQAAAGGDLSLVNTLISAPGGGANALSAIPISQNLLFTVGAEALTEQTMVLSKVLALAEIGDFTSEGAILLSEINTVLQSGGANAGSSVSLSNIQALVAISHAIKTGALSLSKILTIIQAFDEPGEEFVELAMSHILSSLQSGNASAGGDLPLSEVLTSLQSGLAQAECALSIPVIQSIIESGMVGADSNVLLSHILTILQATLSVTEVDLALAEYLAAGGSGMATTGGFSSVAEYLAMSGSSLAAADSLFSLAHILAMQSSKTSAASSVLALAINAGVDATLSVDYSQSISTLQSLGISQSSDANALAQLILNKSLAISILAESIVNAGISLDMVKSITTVGDAIILIITTPDGRTFSIGVEVRNVDIASEPRHISIPDENRTIFIR